MRRILSLAAVTLGVGVTLSAWVMPARADMRGKYVCEVPPNENVVITWQNRRTGYWFCCGPVQCTQAGDKDEDKAIGYCENETPDPQWNWTRDREGRLQYVCEVPVEIGGRSTTGNFYRLHTDREGADSDPRRVIP